MDLRALRYFAFIADNRSFSKAALMLRVGQPALSRCVQQLEEELGVQLLRRSSRGVELTHAGQLLRQRAQEMLDRIDRLRDEVRAQADHITGTAMLGIPSAASQLIAPAIYRHLQEHHPGIRLQVIEGVSAETYERLLAQSMQFGLLYDPPAHRDLIAEPVNTEDMYLVAHRDWIERLGPRPGIRDLDNLPLVLPRSPNSRRLMVEKAFKDRNVVLNVAAEVDGFAATRALLGDGFGLSLMTHSSLADIGVDGLLTSRLLHSDRLSWTLSLVRHRAQPQSQLLRAVAEAIHLVCRELVNSNRWRGCRLAGEPAPS